MVNLSRLQSNQSSIFLKFGQYIDISDHSNQSRKLFVNEMLLHDSERSQSFKFQFEASLDTSDFESRLLKQRVVTAGHSFVSS